MVNNVDCTFCLNPDSIEHAFLNCNVAISFYSEALTWFNQDQNTGIHGSIKILNEVTFESIARSSLAQTMLVCPGVALHAGLTKKPKHFTSKSFLDDELSSSVLFLNLCILNLTSGSVFNNGFFSRVWLGLFKCVIAFPLEISAMIGHKS